MKLTKTKTLLLGTVSALSIAVSPISANAQDTNTSTANSGFAVDEIIVTARRRSENVQDTPIAITAITGEALEARGFQDISQVAKISPNLVFDGAAPVSGNTAAPSVFIRGVGQLDFTTSNDPGVGIYVDGAYVSRSVGGVIDLLDLERVEVLRGPQGTLFGRNTIGGAIQLISKKPTTDEFSGYGEVLTGSDDRIRLKAGVNVPLGETLAAKVSGSYHNRDGYVTNGIGQDLGDDNTYTVRGQLLWEPTDNFSAYIVGDYTEDNENGAPNVAITAFPDGNFAGTRFNTNPGFGCAAPVVPLNSLGDLDTATPEFQDYLAFINGNENCFDLSDLATEENTTNSTTFARQDNEILGLSGTLEYDFGNFSVKSITAYRELDSAFQRDSDHTAFSIFDTANIQEHDQFSQEFILSGEVGAADVVAGVYYFEESATEDVNIFLPAAGGPVNIAGIFENDVDNENFAIFGEVSYDVTDRLHVTGGLRYTDEDKSFTSSQIFTLSESPPQTQFVIDEDFEVVRSLPEGFPTLVTLIDDPGQTVSVDELDYRINIAYDFTDNLLGYATTSTGFKSGGFSPRYLAPTTDQLAIAFQPEFVELYEVGFKSDLLDNRLRLNVAGFYTDYTDIQVSANTPTSNGATVVSNAADATILGLEAEFTFVPSSSVQIEGALGLLDADYGDGALEGLGFSCGTDCDFARIPEVTASWAVSYIHDLPNGATLTPRLDYAFKSQVEGDVNNEPEIIIPQQNIFNLGVAYQNADQDWKATFGISNLTDEEFITSANFNRRLSYAEAIFGRGREWYASISKEF